MKTFSQFLNEEYQFKINHNQLSKKVEKYAPTTYEELTEAIKAEVKLQGPEADLNCINTSMITDMSCLFDPNEHEYTKNFNGDISGWDVSNVTNMQFMFLSAEKFNGDISKWDVSNVKDMYYMFGFAENFNRDISKWNVSNVEDMSYTFCHAKKFNGDISKWDVSNVKKTIAMFHDCPIKEEYKPKFKKIL